MASLQKSVKIYLPLVLALVLLILLPIFISAKWLIIAIYTLWIIYLCCTWNISVLPGLFSLMHGVFLGIGGYFTAVLWLSYKVSPLLGMLAGAAAAAVVALVVGWICFRFSLPILSFAIFTLAISSIALFVVYSFPIAGSTEGVLVRYTGTHPLYFQFESNLVYYYIILGMTLALILLARSIFNSKMGIYFGVIHDNERLAAAGGINVTRYKLLAFAISAALAAMGGTFWTQYYRFVGPETVGTHLTISIILLSVIGGIRTLWGPVVAPLVLVPVGEILAIEFTSIPGLSLMIYGAIVVSILLGLKMGVVNWIGLRYGKTGNAHDN